MTDAVLIATLRNAGEQLRLKASLSSARAENNDVTDYLDEFARGLDDLMADCLSPAKEAFERNERLRAIDPRGHRGRDPVEPAKSWE